MTFKYEIQNHGSEHAQFFPGAGVAFTEFTEIATGSGSSAREAGEDALEIFWQQVDLYKVTTDDGVMLEMAILALSEEEDAHEACYAVPGSDTTSWHEGCERAHFVSIRWRY